MIVKGLVKMLIKIILCFRPQHSIVTSIISNFEYVNS